MVNKILKHTFILVYRRLLVNCSTRLAAIVCTETNFRSRTNFGGKPTGATFQDIQTTNHCKENSILESGLELETPLKLFHKWLVEAAGTPGIAKANAMCLATASKDGQPSARYVMLKGFGNDGLKFFTNFDSRKGKELAENSRASTTFYWEPLRRMVRIEGLVSKLPGEDSDEYFRSRPRDNQIASSISDQSRVLVNRAELTKREMEMRVRYRGKEIPRPPHWGGYVLVPETFEFWQKQSNRVTDRIQFRRQTPGKIHEGKDCWLCTRLSS